MKIQAKSTFSIKSWDERTWDGKPSLDISGEKQTLAQVAYFYKGEVQGESQLQYLMTYRPDNSGNYVGMERVEGSVRGRSGSFVLQHSGTFDAHGVRGTVFVVPGSGTGELKALRGEGSLDLAGDSHEYPLVLEVELD